MIDAELRGWLLLRFYDRRNSNGGSVPVDDMIVSAIEHVGREDIREVCEQLADVELIHWEPLTGARLAKRGGLSWTRLPRARR